MDKIFTIEKILQGRPRKNFTRPFSPRFRPRETSDFKGFLRQKIFYCAA